jgi:phosphatidylglycerophosphate synthase
LTAAFIRACRSTRANKRLKDMMRVWEIRALIVILVILAILLAGAAVFLRQMYPMRLAGTESENERRWIREEEDRRKAELIHEEMGLLVAAGVDVFAIILLFAYARRKRLSSRPA